jgi:hypothetical protein
MEITNLDKEHAKRLKCDWLAGRSIYVCVRLRFGRLRAQRSAGFFLPSTFFSFLLIFSLRGLVENKFSR